ncbi:MAG: hypothetical protein AAF847_14160 [Bacteroidota bacterium]
MLRSFLGLVPRVAQNFVHTLKTNRLLFLRLEFKPTGSSLLLLAARQSLGLTNQ